MNTIRKREMQGYFYTPVGYVFIGVFLTVSSVLFYMQILKQRSGDLPNFIAELCYLWMLLSPILTMRLLAGMNAPIRMMTEEKDSLEEIFLKST